jgi:DNA processing protein
MDTDWNAPETHPADPRLFIALALCDGIGPSAFHRLLSVFGSPEAVFGASGRELTEAWPRMGAGSLIAIGRGPDLPGVERQLEESRRLGIGLVTCRSPGYPAPLLDLPHPPPLLWMQGRWRERDRRSLAVVGTRHPSPYGAEAARRFGLQSAEAGWTVVSGLARGIDTFAHEAALEGGGRTLAVLGSGLDRLSPRENEGLARRVADGLGCVISEFPLGVAPAAPNFPRRNRIISALSRGTLVVEAGNDSGALITARYALDQGREVFAVPGAIMSPHTRGTHGLIKEGASLVESFKDILEVFSGLAQAIPARRFGLLEEDPPGSPTAGEGGVTGTPLPEDVSGLPITAGASRRRHAPAALRPLQLTVPFDLPAARDIPARARPARPSLPADLKASHRLLLEILGEESSRAASRSVSLESLHARMQDLPRARGLPSHRLLAELLQLELLGLVKRLPGAVFRPAA